MFNKINKLKGGDTVYLSDEKSLERHDTVKKIDYTVDNVHKFFVRDHPIYYTIIRLRSLTDEICYLILNENDTDKEVNLYFDIGDFKQGCNRQDALNANEYWLFNKPPSDDFIPSDLIFTDIMNVGDVSYEKKFPTIFGELSGGDDIDFCSITEYKSENDIEHPDVIIFEIGGLDSEAEHIDAGGSIQVVHGYQISESDLDIYISQKEKV